jgi:4-aminobutyrate aminotransferase
MAQLSPHLKPATPVLVDRGEWLDPFGEDGRRYLDFAAGIGVRSTGYCHPTVVAAVQEQVPRLIHRQSTTVLSCPLRELTERLGDVLPPELASLFFVNSGGEAVEAAMRLARHATGRPGIVVLHGSFHGRTFGAAALTTSDTRFSAGIGPRSVVALSPFPFAYRYGRDVETATDFALQELGYVLATIAPPADTAAFFVEPVLGEGGYVPATPGFLQGLRERADRHGILLVIDEIQTGFGRTGRFRGHDYFATHADVLVTAKGLAGGLGLSALAARLEEGLRRVASEDAGVGDVRRPAGHGGRDPRPAGSGRERPAAAHLRHARQRRHDPGPRRDSSRSSSVDPGRGRPDRGRGDLDQGCRAAEGGS